MKNCSEHKKEVAGISDMKVLAKMISDLHYETLADFLEELQCKFIRDAGNDADKGRRQLADHLDDCAASLGNAAFEMKQAWQISKTFMNNK